MSAFVTIDAKPEPMSIDPTRTAVIVVDMQNDFGAKGGMFARAGIDIAPIRKAIAPTKAVLTAARRAGVKVVYLKMEFHPDLSNAGPPESPNRIKHQPLRVGERVTAPDGSQSRILVRGTWNTEILSELRPTPGDLIVSKHRYSGFYGTDLDETLRRLGIEYLIFTGSTTSVCVESTMRDAMFRDYRCILLADCAAEPIGAGLPRSNHEASLLVLQTLFGWVSESAKFIGALEDRRIPSAR
jgi:ureidoacrylate peracid hydrolase